MGNVCQSVKHKKGEAKDGKENKIKEIKEVKEVIILTKEGANATPHSGLNNEMKIIKTEEEALKPINTKKENSNLDTKQNTNQNININIDVKIINQGTSAIVLGERVNTVVNNKCQEENKDRKNTYLDNLESNQGIIIDSNVIVSKGLGNPFEFYTKEKKLGEGSYGQVYLVRHKVLTSSYRAMKELKKNSNDISKEAETEIMNEINILKKMDHPNIVKLYEFYNQPDAFYLVTEFCKQGELFKLIIENGKFDEGFTAYIMFQILSAVYYCHNIGIIHRDLKPENILIENEERNGYLRIKVIDFGTAQVFEKGKIQRKVIGSAYYIAPEVLMKNYNEKCDLWSCGVIMYILLSSRPPFGGSNDSEIIQKIRIGSFDLCSPPFNKLSVESKNLISALLTKDPSKRISAEEALNHPWFKKLKTKEKLNELKNNKFKYINNLKSYRSEKVLQSAALAYLVHNFNQIDEIRDANKLFNNIDANGDGKITKLELVNGLRQYLSISDERLEEDVEKIFRNIDADNNGYIEYEEFVRAAIDKEKLLTTEILQFAFRYFDKDGSGEITHSEIKETFFNNRKNDPNVKAQLDFIISEVDTDGDGKISFEEFSIMMQNIIKEN